MSDLPSIPAALSGFRIDTDTVPARRDLEALFRKCDFLLFEYLPSWFDSPVAFVAVYLGNDLVAYTSAHWNTPEHHLEWRDLVVAPEKRRQGIGVAISNILLEVCRAHVSPLEPRLKISAKPAKGRADRYRRMHDFSGSDDSDLSRWLYPLGCRDEAS
jgi:GNAT superfamily N-acetyltransferase